MSWLLLGALLVAAFYFDHRFGRIPNPLTAGGIAAGFILQPVLHGAPALLDSAAGVATGFLPLLLLYFFGALGAGDVKLFASIGAIMGVQYVLDCMIYSILFAGVIGFVVLAARRLLIHRLRFVFLQILAFLHIKDFSMFAGMPNKEMLRFPFMYAVMPAYLATVYMAAG